MSMDTELENAMEEIGELRTALELYGLHKEDCHIRVGRRAWGTARGVKCTCGLDAALKGEQPCTMN